MDSQKPVDGDGRNLGGHEQKLRSARARIDSASKLRLARLGRTSPTNELEKRKKIAPSSYCLKTDKLGRNMNETGRRMNEAAQKTNETGSKMLETYNQPLFQLTHKYK